MTRRILIAAVCAVGLASSLAVADESTTFAHESAGCAGGGNACGTFPLVPVGDAEYEHAAGPDGSIAIAAAAERGLPGEVCLPERRCEPLFRYHAEALGRVWAHVTTPSGAVHAAVIADYDIEELEVETLSLGGAPEATVAGTISLAPAPASANATCSDGSAIVGADTLVIDANTPEGEGTFSAGFSCAGEGATLPAMTWRVRMTLTVSATTDGGNAEAVAAARLTRAAAAGAIPLG